ncbi:MAG: endonuclease/exonuclease/phosphatase family protein [Brevirhabdus sp.]
MTRFTAASFNVKNLIGPQQEYYRFEQYTQEEYAWKADWLADQVLTLNADIVAFQEVFSDDPLRDVVNEANRRGLSANEDVIPDPSKRYARKAIFDKLAFTPYTDAELAFAPNASDEGEPGHRRPGLAILSRHGFAEPPEVIQVLDTPLTIEFRGLAGEEAGHFTLHRTSRPIQKARIDVGGHVVTVFNCHLKSKLGEYPRDPGTHFAAESDLTNYDPVGRAMGSLRASVRRMAEAVVLRELVVAELAEARPVIVMGDMNDADNAVSSQIVAGEVPFKNYAWLRRHDAQQANERYSRAESEQITEDIDSLRLHSAEKLFVRRSLRDMVYTTSFGGVFESIDQILLSRHFHPDFSGYPAEMLYFSTFNDHLTDGSHPEAPYNKLASDHGQIMAHLQIGDRTER